MIRQHRTTALLLTAALSLAACGSDGDADSTAEAPTTDAAPATDPEADTTDDDTAATAPEADAPVDTEAADEAPADTEDDTNDDTEDEADTDTADEALATTAPAVFPRTVEHSLGSTEIAEEPIRIVSLDRSLTDPVLSLGLELAGYTTYQDPNGALPEYFGDALTEHASDAQWVGDLLEPNLEAILAAQPDLIVTSKVRHETIYDQLSQIAPTIMTESGGVGWKDNLHLVAEATGTEARADELIAEYEAHAAEVGAAINEAADSPTLSVIRFLGEIRLYQPASFSGTVLADAGLARPDSQQDEENFILSISEEELLLADADYVFYTVYDNPDAADAFNALADRPLWGSLEAVQNGRAYPVLDDLWMSGVGLYGARAILDDLATTFGVDV